MSFLDRLLGRAKPKTTLELLRMREALPVEQAMQFDQRAAGLPIISPAEARELAPPTESELNPLLGRVKTDRRGFLDLLRTGVAAAAVPGKVRAAAPIIDPMVKNLLEGAAENPLSIMARAVQKGGDLDPWIDELVDRGGLRPSGALHLLKEASTPRVQALNNYRSLLRGEYTPEQSIDLLRDPTWEVIANGSRGNPTLASGISRGDLNVLEGLPWEEQERLFRSQPLDGFAGKFAQQFGLQGDPVLPQGLEELYSQSQRLATPYQVNYKEGRSGPRVVWREPDESGKIITNTETFDRDKDADYFMEELYDNMTTRVLDQLRQYPGKRR